MNRRTITGLLAGTLAVALTATGCSSNSSTTPSTASSSTSAAVAASGSGSAPSETSSAVAGSSSSSSVAVVAPTATLNVVALVKPASLNPALNNISANDGWHTQLAYASLIHIDDKGQPQPALATSWKYVGTGNKEFQVTLRSGVKFADGTPLTAQAAANSLKYSLKANGPAGAFLGTIASVTATGPSTLDFKLNAANPSMPFVLSNVVQFGDIISAKGLASPTDLGHATAGAGPYVLDESQTVSGDHYTYTPNTNYYDPGAIHYKSVTIKIVSDTNAALNVLKTGSADLALGDINTADSAKSAGLTVSTGLVAQSGIDLIDRNGTVVKQLADVKVRQALNYAVDRETIAKGLLQGYGTAVNQVGTPGTNDYVTASADQYKYDPAKAKQLLTEAGYPDGFSADMVIFSQNPPTSDIAQAVISDWAKVGVKINAVTDSDGGKYVQDITSKKYGMFSYGYGYIPFFLYSASFYLPVNGPFNPFVSNDPQLTALAAQANAASGAQQKTLEDQANQRALDLAWIVPVASYSVFYFTTPKVGNVKVSAARPLLDLTELTPTS